MGRYKDSALFCAGAVILDCAFDFRTGLYCISDFDHCGSDRACVIEGLGKRKYGHIGALNLM